MEKTPESDDSMRPRVVPNIFQRILSVMSELDYIEKGSAKVNNQYRFVSHDKVTAKVHPLLVKYGIVVIPSVEVINQVGNRTEVKLCVFFRNADVPEDGFFVYSYGYGIDNGDKGPGKAVSYAFKYAMLKVFCLETGDDPDNDADAVYEAEKCLEFDAQLPDDMSDKDQKKLEKFLQSISKSTNKHVEDIKREAVKRMPEFLQAFKKWSPKKKNDDEKEL